MKTNIKRSPIAIVGYAIAIAAILFSIIILYGQYAPAPEEGGDVTLLFVQTAHSGTLSEPGSDNTRTLTLNDVSPTTVFFSDRPDRITGHEATGQFIEEWGDGDNSFLDNPPNAALDILGDDSQSVVILELINPVYDANTRTLRYDAIILKESDTDVSQYGKELDFSIFQSFSEAALFIDSTYKNYHCDCTVDSPSDSCTCEYSYTLGKSATKEFRAYCTAEESKPDGIHVGKKKDTTCTAENFVWRDYATASCTNWDPIDKDKVRVITKCVWADKGAYDYTHKDYHCGCAVDLEKDCTCEYSYTLKESATKEFRAYCTGEKSKPVGVSTTGTKEDTTCIGKKFEFDAYTTRSCTNWSPAHTDEITVIAKCEYSDSASNL